MCAQQGLMSSLLGFLGALGFLVSTCTAAPRWGKCLQGRSMQIQSHVNTHLILLTRVYFWVSCLKAIQLGTETMADDLNYQSHNVNANKSSN